MSRSRRKTPIVGHTTCRSEREDKKLWHQRWRTHERTALASASPEALCAHLPLLENQVSNVWSMGKDGVVCGRGRNPTLRLWPTIFSGKIDVFPGDRRSRLISSMTSVAPA
ncbi:TPA: hypothetical protein L5D80_003319 [Pseudomonas aeruginosa]|nr:hypothetical protein [Pseudomonas aeruginosa]